MNTPRSIIISSLFGCWAILLATRIIAAAIYANAPTGSYAMGLVHVGWVVPVSAWLCFAAGLLMLIAALNCKKGEKDAA